MGVFEKKLKLNMKKWLVYSNFKFENTCEIFFEIFRKLFLAEENPYNMDNFRNILKNFLLHSHWWVGGNRVEINDTF